MAEFTGILTPGDINTVHSRTAINFGTRAFDQDGNEFIFLKGIDSTVVGSWVTYDSTSFDTTLLAANALGPVAVAMGAIITGKKGWYQVWGNAIACAGATLDVNDVVGRTGADGYVGDGPPAGDIIYNCLTRSAMEDGSANTTSTFSINYPYVDDQTASH